MAYFKMLLQRVALLLVLFQLSRIAFYAFNYPYFGSIPITDWLQIVIGGTRFDLSMLMYANALYILLFILPVPFRSNNYYQSFGKVVFVLTNGICLLANFIDAAYFPFVLRRTNASFLLEFSNDTALLKGTVGFVTAFWPIAITAGVFILLLYISYNWVQMPQANPKGARQLALQMPVVPFVALLWLGLARGSFNPDARPVNTVIAGAYVTRPVDVNLVLNTPISVFTTFDNTKVAAVSYFASLEEAQRYYQPIKQYHKVDAFKPKNVVIIVVESLSKEFVGRLNQGIEGYQSYTPFIDSLMGRSLTFEYGIANGRRSIEALPSIIASIPSHEEAFSITPYLANSFNSLVTVLDKREYYTTFYHGGREGTMGFANFMRIAGVDATFSKNDYPHPADDDGTWGIWDEPYLQYWAEEMNKMQEPFFSTVFTLSSHHPFELPIAYTDSFSGGPLPIQRCVQYTDMALRKFFQTAATMPWYYNTVFVVLADHVAPYSHYDRYYNSLGHYSIPIIYFTPDASLKGRSDMVTQQNDIFPTLVDYLGISDTIVAFGNSVLRNNGEHLVVNYTAGMYQAFYKDYLMHFDGQNPTALYKYTVDPTLSNNVLGQHPAEEQELLLKIKAYLQQYSTRLRQNKMLP